ncbi:MAG: hypothetical protein H6Q07_2909 [Acidobacteria bacterium]|nr:hypothetical protein [Acidobacteriota bacterium]
MHTENTEKELSVFSGCIFSVAGMCTGRTKISPYAIQSVQPYEPIQFRNPGSNLLVRRSRFKVISLEP